MSRDLMGTAEIAELLKVSQTRVRQLAESSLFPAPIARLQVGSVWDAEEIRTWVAGQDVKVLGKLAPKQKQFQHIVDGWHTVAEAAEVLHCSKSWIYKAVESEPPAQPIPHHRRGNRLLFSQQDLQEIIEAGRVGQRGASARTR